MRIGRSILGIVLLLFSVMPAAVYAGTSGPSPIPAPPAFQISASSLTLCRGVVNNVPVKISNPGTQPMTSVQLGIVASRNIYAIGNGTVTTSTVPSNSSVMVNLPIFVSLNTSDLVSAGISITYNYLTLYSDSEVRNVSFGVQTCSSPLSISVNHTITSGKIDTVVLNLTNTGNTTLNAISVRTIMPSQDAAVLSNQPVQVGALLPGGAAQINVSTFVYRNASQSFPMNVSVSMFNGTSPVQMLNSIQLLSAGIINMTPSSITLSPTLPGPGSIFSVSFVLTDIGTSGASAVSVTAMPQQGFTSFGSNSTFVGDMAVDTQTPVTITLLANRTLQPGSYTIPVRISYLNNFRQNLSTVIDVPLTIGSSSGAQSAGSGPVVVRSGSGSAGGGLIILFLLVVIVVLGYLYYRERKRTHKAK
ncbi:MAG: hypothetical protein M1286_02735 [Candidatus Marsarchaeota archaeon]|nr:hypothetical protein [Candidatus Marsarchaeota archaeon]